MRKKSFSSLKGVYSLYKSVPHLLQNLSSLSVPFITFIVAGSVTRELADIGCCTFNCNLLTDESANHLKSKVF